MRLVSTLLILCLACPALAAPKKRGPGKPSPARTAEHCKGLEGDRAEACKVIGTYLDLWKQQKWGELKKLVHPKTQEVIATAKKNTGNERHGMAPWYWAKETFLLTDWKLVSVQDGASATVVINTTEDSYRIEEDGMLSGEEASYLAGRLDGKWYVVDRRGGGGGFDKTSIEIGMKGYFDAPVKAPEATKAP